MVEDMGKPADGDTQPNDAALGKASIRKAIERLSGTPLWTRCSKRTLKRLERFLGSERVPDGVDADAFAFYTAQGYLNGAVASMIAHYEGDRDDALAKRGRKYLDVTSGSAELVESVKLTIGGQKPMLDGFERGFSDGVSTMAEYSISKDETARLLTVSLVSALLGVAGTSGELDLYLEDNLVSILEDASYPAYCKDCVLFVSECIEDDGNIEPMVLNTKRRFSDGRAISAHIGVPTARLRDTLARVIPSMQGYINERVLPTMGVCSDEYTLPAEYATAHAYGMLSALLRPAENDDNAPLVADVICDASQDEMAEFVKQSSNGIIDNDAVYGVLADLAAALARVGKSLESDDDNDDGRSILSGVVDAYLTWGGGDE